MKKFKVLAIVLIAVFALAIFAACDPKTDASGDNDSGVGNEKGTTAFDLLSKEDIGHIVGYCATFTQKKGTSVWWEYRYYAYSEETPDGCVEISITPGDGTKEIEHECVEFMYVFKDNEAAQNFVDLLKQNAQENGDSDDKEYLVDGNCVYQTKFLYDSKTHEKIGSVTVEEQKKFYTEKVLKATLPSTFSKARLDFISESMANKIHVSSDFTIANEYEYDDYKGVHKKETYEKYSCASDSYSGSLEDIINVNLDYNKMFGYEYMYWSDGCDPVEVGWYGVDKHIEEIKQNGNSKDKYIDAEREEGFSFYLYTYPHLTN